MKIGGRIDCIHSRQFQTLFTYKLSFVSKRPTVLNGILHIENEFKPDQKLNHSICYRFFFILKCYE